MELSRTKYSVSGGRLCTHHLPRPAGHSPCKQGSHEHHALKVRMFLKMQRPMCIEGWTGWSPFNRWTARARLTQRLLQ
eukprot:3226128-Amphidinium_carterae.1